MASSVPEFARASRQADRHTDRYRKGNMNILHPIRPLQK